MLHKSYKEIDDRDRCGICASFVDCTKRGPCGSGSYSASYGPYLCKNPKNKNKKGYTDSYQNSVDPHFGICDLFEKSN